MTLEHVLPEGLVCPFDRSPLGAGDAEASDGGGGAPVMYSWSDTRGVHRFTFEVDEMGVPVWRHLDGGRLYEVQYRVAGGEVRVFRKGD